MVIYSIPYDTITYNMSHNMSYNTRGQISLIGHPSAPLAAAALALTVIIPTLLPATLDGLCCLLPGLRHTLPPPGLSLSH